jgi:hypothetical protein
MSLLSGYPLSCQICIKLITALLVDQILMKTESLDKTTGHLYKIKIYLVCSHILSKPFSRWSSLWQHHKSLHRNLGPYLAKSTLLSAEEWTHDASVGIWKLRRAFQVLRLNELSLKPSNPLEPFEQVQLSNKSHEMETQSARKRKANIIVFLVKGCSLFFSLTSLEF